MPEIVFAFDRKTARSKDADGRMRVKDCVLSTAEVNPYPGGQIPKWQDLGLAPNKIYELYRDPDELRKAVPTFEGIPLMVKHVVQTAEQPRKEYQAGSVHSITFDGKHLRGDLLVTDGYAIDLIESDELSDLSCGYRYKPVMQPGEAGGSKYDGVMREIQGNHVALVDDGRATGAHVADSAMRENPQTPDPTMQQESNMAFPEENKEPAAAAPAGNEAPPAEGAAPAPGSPQGEANEQVNMAAIGQALKHIAGLLENIHGRLGGGAEPAAAAPAAPGAMDSDTDAPTPENPENEADPESTLRMEPAVGANDEEDGPPLIDNQEGTGARGNETPHGAMDSKSVQSLVAAAVKAERARAARVDQAKRDVRGVLGDVIGMDSAGDIYREALMQSGMDVSQLAKGQEKMAWDAFRSARGAAVGVRQGAGGSGSHAMDSKGGQGGAQVPAYMAHLGKIAVKG